MKWISVKDRLPEKSGYYLITYSFDNHRFYKAAWFNQNYKFATTANDIITHWMPLPEPPESTASEVK
ncbi:DUF551 domain-containing protein [Candidatus Parcubacteria bacterium]|nr:DUF551 domain-containing protein [Candidatus Parcubacteria bacterium]